MGRWDHAARARRAFGTPWHEASHSNSVYQEERQAVSGSLPATANSSGFLAGVAQLVEHVLGKDGVTGAIPVSSFAVTHAIHPTSFP